MEIQTYIEGLYGIQTNIDVNRLKETSHKMERVINTLFNSDEFDYAGGTQTTKLFNKYNFLLYPFPGVHELYWTIHEAFHRCLTLDQGIVEDKFAIECWLNVFKKGEFIDWHNHAIPQYRAWHGFLCVDTEPKSFTSYRWPDIPERKDIQIDIPSKNGLIVLGKSNGDIHKSSKWNIAKRNRITIAFDIMPIDILTEHTEIIYHKFNSTSKTNPQYINHWIPI